MIILSIETSCDETSAALLKCSDSGFEVLSHVVSSSVKEQAKYGGIVPEVAARKQMEYVIPVLQEVFNKSGVSGQMSDVVSAIAVTVGPGLATSLQVGIDTAKTLAYAWHKPIIPVNHLEGHLLSPLITTEKEFLISNSQFLKKSQPSNSKSPKINFPAIGLIVSGGHTELILMKDYAEYELLGRTRDDAAGEAFDKVAKLLDLEYPGGPVVSKLAEQGDPAAFDFPRGMMHSDDYDFSFSGLKTAVLYKRRQVSKVKGQMLYDFCASFQQAVIDVLVSKTIKAAKEYNAPTILLGGGVVANPLLRKVMVESSQMSGVKCHMSPITYTGDNAAMIALAGYVRQQRGEYIAPDPQLSEWQTLSAQPNMKLV